MSQMSMFAKVTERNDPSKWAPPQVLPDLRAHKKIWMDTETTGKNPFLHQPVGISGYTEDGKKWYLPWGHAGGGNLDEKVIKRWAKKELVDKDITFINAKFDNHMLRRWGIDLEEQGCRLHDVAFSAALLDERRRRFNLEQLGQDVLGRGKEKEIRKEEKGHIADMPSSMVGPYAEDDAELVYALDMALRYGTNSKLPNSIRSDGMERVLDLEDACIFAVTEMEHNGAILDRPLLEQWIRETQDEEAKLTLELWQKTRIRVNPDSPGDMTQLFKYLGIEPPKTPKGENSFEGQYLKRLVQYPEVQLARRLREVKSIRSKYLLKYLRALDSNNILRYSLHQLRGDENGTISGRFSCAAPDSGGANIQQVFKVDRQLERFGPRWIIRQLFIPSPGKFWVSYDAAQIEFRLFVHYVHRALNSDRLLQYYRADPKVDFHNVVLSLIQKVVPDFKRTPAKTINFAKIYGGGRNAIAIQMGVDRSVSDPFVDVYEAEFPESGRLLRKCTNLAETRGHVKTALGRLARFIKPSSSDPKIRMMEEIAYKPHSALNRVLQGTAADIMKDKMVRVHKERKYFGLTERLTVHDEGDGDMDDPKKVAELEELLNTQHIPFDVPILWETETGRNWRLGKGMTKEELAAEQFASEEKTRTLVRDDMRAGHRGGNVSTGQLT